MPPFAREALSCRPRDVYPPTPIPKIYDRIFERPEPIIGRLKNRTPTLHVDAFETISPKQVDSPGPGASNLVTYVETPITLQ
jgi:hypothetical protein